MKHVLVLGATGMLGFAVHRFLHDAGAKVTGAVRRVPSSDQRWAQDLSYVQSGDLADTTLLEPLLREGDWDVVINCIAEKKGADIAPGGRLHTLIVALPAMLGRLTAETDLRLIHFSTDAVFLATSGAPFSETATPIAEGLDAYASSKLEGEQTSSHALTIRTSMIGIAPMRPVGMLPWLLSADGPVVQGYANYLFTGLPVTEIARFLAKIVMDSGPVPHGILHLPGPAISKYELLRLCIREWGRSNLALEAIQRPVVDLRLRSVHEVADRSTSTDWPSMLHLLREFYDRYEVRID